MKKVCVVFHLRAPCMEYHTTRKSSSCYELHVMFRKYFFHFFSGRDIFSLSLSISLPFSFFLSFSPDFRFILPFHSFCVFVCPCLLLFRVLFPLLVLFVVYCVLMWLFLFFPFYPFLSMIRRWKPIGRCWCSFFFLTFYRCFLGVLFSSSLS